MYRVLGADGKEYGPVSGDVLRQWISEGRTNAQTQVKPEGAAEWQAVASVQEFAPLFAPAPGGGLAQTLSMAATPAKTSGMAITSLVLGVLGLFTCGVTSLVGLVLGIIALLKVNRSGGHLSGRGFAIAGICTSALFLLMVPMYAAILLPALAKAKSKAQSINCMNNMKQLSLGVMMYTQSNSNKYPPSDQWCDAIMPQVGSPKVFRCPAAPQSDRSDYAFNQKLSEAPMSKVTNPARTVLIFECDGGWNQQGGPELALRRSRHAGPVIIGFADGHVESVSSSQLNGLVWSP